MKDEKNVLTAEEKKMLQAYYNCINNFDEIKYVTFFKIVSEIFTDEECICLRWQQNIIGKNLFLSNSMPYFKSGSYFKGMIADKIYTPKELGLVTHRKKKASD